MGRGLIADFVTNTERIWAGWSLKSKLCYDRRSVGQSWCQALIWGPRHDFCYCQTVEGLLMWRSLSDEMAGLSFTIATGPRQCTDSQVRAPRESWPCFTVSDSRPRQPVGPGPRIYILPEQGGPVIYPGAGFPFRRLLRLAGFTLTNMFGSHGC
jgi:hypothetical protein